MAGTTRKKTRTKATPVAPPRISYAELERMLRDPNVSEAQLRPYFEPDRKQFRPFHPALRVNRARVTTTEAEELRAEGFSTMNYANDLSRWRRHMIFRTRRQLEKLPVLVSEGDSWFQFPILLDDVIDQLGKDYLIWSVDAAGDTLGNMVQRYPEYPAALAKWAGTAKAFLFSGAGNDMVGDDADGRSEIAKVLQEFKAGEKPAWYIDTPAYREKLKFIEECYRTVLSRLRQDFPALPVIVHGYDYAIPGPAPQEWRHPIYAKVDEWIGSGFTELKINEHATRCDIIRLMIDDLNTCQRKLCGGNVAGGEFKKAYHVDVRGIVTGKDWADELHPTSSGFAKVAARFRKVLQEAGV